MDDLTNEKLGQASELDMEELPEGLDLNNLKPVTMGRTKKGLAFRDRMRSYVEEHYRNTDREPTEAERDAIIKKVDTEIRAEFGE